MDHTVTALEDEIPDGPAYFASGGFDSESAARDAHPYEGILGPDDTFEHTSETPGESEYAYLAHGLIVTNENVTVTEEEAKRSSREKRNCLRGSMPLSTAVVSIDPPM